MWLQYTNRDANKRADGNSSANYNPTSDHARDNYGARSDACSDGNGVASDHGGAGLRDCCTDRIDTRPARPHTGYVRGRAE
jgi:hypothetical protein